MLKEYQSDCGMAQPQTIAAMSEILTTTIQHSESKADLPKEVIVDSRTLYSPDMDTVISFGGKSFA